MAEVTETSLHSSIITIIVEVHLIISITKMIDTEVEISIRETIKETTIKKVATRTFTIRITKEISETKTTAEEITETVETIKIIIEQIEVAASMIETKINLKIIKI